MGRIRSVHPGLFTDERFAALSAGAQILLIGLWTEADDNGVFEWKPMTLKMRLLPLASVDIGALLEELRQADCIRKVEMEGDVFGLARDFGKHQKPRRRVVRHPFAEEHRAYVGQCPPERREEERREEKSSEEEIGEKGEGGEKEGGGAGAPPRKKGTRLPDDWQVSEALRAWVKAQGLRIDWQAETEQFRDYWRAKPGAAGVKLDWEATWRKWMRKAERDLPRERNAPVLASIDDAMQWRRRLEGFRANALWLEAWGARPGERACQAPRALLAEYGFAAGASAEAA